MLDSCRLTNKVRSAVKVSTLLFFISACTQQIDRQTVSETSESVETSIQGTDSALVGVLDFVLVMSVAAAAGLLRY